MEQEPLRPSSKIRGMDIGHGTRVSQTLQQDERKSGKETRACCSIVPRPTFLPLTSHMHEPRPTFLPLTSHMHEKIPGSPHSSCNRKWCRPRNKAKGLPGLENEGEPGTYSHQSEVTIGDLKMNVGYRETVCPRIKECNYGIALRQRN